MHATKGFNFQGAKNSSTLEKKILVMYLNLTGTTFASWLLGYLQQSS